MAKRSVSLRHYFLKEINFVIRFLIISDTVFVGASGLLAPIFALYIEDFIVGGSAEVAGIAAAIFLLTKSFLQIPIAAFIDKIRGEKDDFYILLVSTLLLSVAPLLLLVIDTPLELYGLQFILGLLTALTFPSYMAIFTKHIDKNKEGTEWGVYFTLTDISSAALAALGGYFATAFGFPFLIVVMVILSVLGSLLLLPIRPYLKLR